MRIVTSNMSVAYKQDLLKLDELSDNDRILASYNKKAHIILYNYHIRLSCIIYIANSIILVKHIYRSGLSHFGRAPRRESGLAKQ